MASCDTIILYLYISWRDHPDLKIQILFMDSQIHPSTNSVPLADS